MYRSNNGTVRRQLWSSLCNFKTQIGDQPWLIGGDLNIVKGPDERFGGMGSSMFEDEFCHCVRELEVLDHPYVGDL